MKINTDNLRGKKLLICEEALTSFEGHYYSWIKAIRKINIEAGVHVYVASNVNIDTRIKEEFDTIPAYTHNNWSGIYNHKSPVLRYLAVFRHNVRVWKQTKRVLKQVGHVDCIILPSARIHQLLAWRALCGSHLNKGFNRLVIFILMSEAIYNRDFTKFHFKKTSLLLRNVLQSFAQFIKKNSVVMAGDSNITAGEYEFLSKVPFRVFPSPAAGFHGVAQPDLTNRKAIENPCTFVILGVSVYDKGIDLLQAAIVNLLSQFPELAARFIIQWSVPTIDYNYKVISIDPALRQAPQVILLEKVLDDFEYSTYLQEADFLVLPYRRKIYFNRISGVAIEAACSGIPLIVTENTWLSSAMREFGAGLTVKDEDANDLAEKILEAIAKRNDLKHAAQQQKTVALERNSKTRYLQSLWG